MMTNGKRRAALLSVCSSPGDHVEISGKPGNPGSNRQKPGAHDGSLGSLQKALQDLEASVGPQSRRLVPLLVELGNAYGDAKQLEKKKDCINRALHIQEREYGPTHAQCAVLLANLGNAYTQLGDQERANACYERALAIHEREYGSKHRALVKKAMGFAPTERSRPSVDRRLDGSGAQADIADRGDLFSRRSEPQTPSEVSRVVLWMNRADPIRSEHGSRGKELSLRDISWRGEDAKPTVSSDWDDEPANLYVH
jgi:tetratricopeptide (TPR) repeat protein